MVRQTRLSSPIGLLPGLPSSAADGPLNILVAGLDDPSQVVPPASRADSITLIHITPDRRRVYLIDFERDVSVDIPGHGQGKINSAYQLGGTRLLVQVVTSLTGVHIDGAVVVTLDAFSQLTDRLGGIDMCLPAQVTSHHTGRTFPVGVLSL